MFTKVGGISITLAGLFLLGACSEPVTQIESAGSPKSASYSAVKFWEVNSSVRWNRKAVSLFRARNGDFGRINAYATLASYRAALAAQDAKGKVHPSTSGAIAGAAVVVLKQFFPSDAANIEAEIAAQRDGPTWPGEEHEDFAAGEALGRTIGAQVLASAATDNYGVEDPGSPPLGAGYWVSAPFPPPIRGGYHARPFFLTTSDELILPPPPVFGSAEYLAARAAVRQLSDNRTPAQLAITFKWIPFSSVLFDSTATELAVKYHKSDVETARTLAYANLAAYDAIIACFNNKYRYWYIRPSQSDPLITTPAGLPNHPSYPSAHSCQSGAWVEVLSDAFPAEKDMLGAMGDEAAFSREVAGLHYHFDNVAGLLLGHTAGKLALQRRGIE